MIWTPCYICIILYLYNIYFFMYIIILAINCHGLFCLWVVSLLQCRSSIFVFIFFIYVLYVTNHQNHCKCKMQMSVILCSHGPLDWFNKTILFYTTLSKQFEIAIEKGRHSHSRYISPSFWPVILNINFTWTKYLCDVIMTCWHRKIYSMLL